MNGQYAHLLNRAVLRLSGADGAHFLQGLITNDLEQISDGEGAGAIFAGLLSPQGKLLFDFFLTRQEDIFLIDVAASCAAELVKRLTFYKLRADVVIEDCSQSMAVLVFWREDGAALAELPDTAYPDPRYGKLGARVLVPKDEMAQMVADWPFSASDAQSFEAHRIRLMVPEGGVDYVFGDSFLHEACFDQLNGVNFKKGCYVGQEVVSRMQHRGTARKRIMGVQAEDGALTSGDEIIADGRVIGKVGSVWRDLGIALVRIDRAAKALEEGQAITANGGPITLIKPQWALFDVAASLEGQTS